MIRSEESSLVSDTRKDIETQVKKLSKRTSKGERREIYQELRHLRKELRVREREITDRIMRNARVIFTTLAGAGSRKLGQERFDVVVVDEVCQSLEAECWIALLKGARLILAGDPHQLPPTVKSTAVATRKGLERTLFDRLKSAYGEHALRLLTVQYRMNKAIMEWANIAMYDGRLQAHESAKERTLLDLPGVQKTDDTEQVIVMVDTAGCGLLETIADDGESKSNEGEAKLCVKYVVSLALRS